MSHALVHLALLSVLRISEAMRLVKDSTVAGDPPCTLCYINGNLWYEWRRRVGTHRAYPHGFNDWKRGCRCQRGPDAAAAPKVKLGLSQKGCVVVQPGAGDSGAFVQMHPGTTQCTIFSKLPEGDGFFVMKGINSGLCFGMLRIADKFSPAVGKCGEPGLYQQLVPNSHGCLESPGQECYCFTDPDGTELSTDDRSHCFASDLPTSLQLTLVPSPELQHAMLQRGASGLFAEYTVQPTDRTRPVFEQFCQELGLPLSQFRFELNGKKLDPESSMADNGIEADDAIDVIALWLQ